MPRGFCKDIDITTCNVNQSNYSKRNARCKSLFNHRNFYVGWWNGGGCIRKRILLNKSLSKFLESKPDVFVYGEAGTSSKQRLILPGYSIMLHRAKIEETSSFRRGLAIFYLEKYSQIISRACVSKKYDIFWIRLDSPKLPVFFCFYYTPGCQHPERVRNDFFMELQMGFDKYKKIGSIFMLGDSNTRLGPVLNDRNIHGKYVSNKNKPYFMGFLEYSGMHLLNKIHAIGKPTFEILERKKSIIDLALASSMELVSDFKILPDILGTTIQTGHKIILLSLKLHSAEMIPGELKEDQPYFRKMFKYCTYEHLLKVRNRVLRKLREIEHIRSLIGRKMHPTYTTFLKLYFTAKVKHIGYCKENTTSLYLSQKVKDLQNRILAATNVFQKTKSDLSLFLLQHLQKLLQEQYKSEKTKQFHQWLSKLNQFDYKGRIREFYRSLKRNMKEKTSMGPVIDEKGNLSRSRTECLSNWKKFYETLYSSTRPTFNLLPGPHDTELDDPFSYTELVLAVASLSEHKSCGADYISGNDMTVLLHVDPEDHSFLEGNVFILESILSMINSLWKSERAPPVLKQSILRPILKAADSDPTNPRNYRPISLLNTVMKLYEALIKKRLIKRLETSKLLSPVQAAYRTNRSTCDHLLMIQELFLEYRFKPGSQKRPLYFCFIDLRQAFDTIYRDKLFLKVHNIGIKGKMNRVISDLYNKNIARVQVGNFLSSALIINRGVMQGSKLGPILFNIFINDLLNDLNNSSLGARIGNLVISTLGFADDILLIADSPSNLQKLIDICDKWSKVNDMCFNLKKCKVMVFNSDPQNLYFHLQNQILEIVTSYKYLGILLSSGARQHTLYKEHFARILEKAQTRVNCIKHYGFHKDGLRPQTAIRLYKVLIRPLLEYGAQVLSYRKYFLNSSRLAVDVDIPTFYRKDLEDFQTKTLKTLIGCPRNVSPSVVRLVTGVEPICCRLDMLKLRYYWKKTHSPPSMVSEFINHRKKNLLEHNLGFVTEVFNLCCRIGNISFWHGIHREKSNPLNLIKRTVTAHYFNKDINTARNKTCIFSTLFLNNQVAKEKKYKLTKTFQRNGQFSTASSRVKFVKAILNTNSYLQECKQCSLKFYDILLHQLTTCPKLTKQRLTLKQNFILYGTEPIPKLDNPTSVISYALSKKILLKAFTDFLETSA